MTIIDEYEDCRVKAPIFQPLRVGAGLFGQKIFSTDLTGVEVQKYLPSFLYWPVRMSNSSSEFFDVS